MGPVATKMLMLQALNKILEAQLTEAELALMEATIDAQLSTIRLRRILFAGEQTIEDHDTVEQYNLFP